MSNLTVTQIDGHWWIVSFETDMRKMIAAAFDVPAHLGLRLTGKIAGLAPQFDLCDVFITDDCSEDDAIDVESK